MSLMMTGKVHSCDAYNTEMHMRYSFAYTLFYVYYLPNFDINQTFFE